MKRVTVTRQSPTGRNLRFRDNKTGRYMSRPEFVRAINNGMYKRYHVRRVNGVSTPAANPNRTTSDNLG
jgi:hypothetical protein